MLCFKSVFQEMKPFRRYLFGFTWLEGNKESSSWIVFIFVYNGKFFSTCLNPQNVGGSDLAQNLIAVTNEALFRYGEVVTTKKLCSFVCTCTLAQFPFKWDNFMRIQFIKSCQLALKAFYGRNGITMMQLYLKVTTTTTSKNYDLYIYKPCILNKII